MSDNTTSNMFPLHVRQWARNICKNIQSRCKDRFLPFDLTFNFLQTSMFLQRERCFYCHRPFDLISPKREVAQMNVPSIDRVDPNPTVGYVQTNVVISCQGCNSLKADASLSDLERLARGIRKHRRNRNDGSTTTGT